MKPNFTRSNEHMSELQVTWFAQPSRTHPDIGATQPYHGMPQDLSELFEAESPKLDAGEYMPAVPPQVRIESADDLTATAMASRRLCLAALTQLLESRSQDQTGKEPHEIDYVMADKSTENRYAAGWYDPTMFSGQVAVAIKRVWEDGSREHIARQNGEKPEHELALGPTLARYMFELHLAHEESTAVSADTAARLHQLIEDYQSGMSDTDIATSIVTPIEIEGTAKFRSIDQI